MAAGANIGSAIGGFGRGLASALIMNRERSDQKKREERERADRAFQYQLPVLIKLGEDTGDWSALENAFATAFPDQAKSWKKDNFSIASIAPMLQRPSAMRGPQSTEVAPQVPTGMTAPPGMPQQPDVLSSRAAAAPATPVQRKTLFGVELPTDEERAERAVNIESATNQARMSARRKYYDQLVSQGVPAGQAWQMAGLPEAPRPINVGVNDLLVDPITGKTIAQGMQAPTSSGGGTELDREIARIEREQGRPMTAAERLELRRRIATAERAPGSAAGGADQTSLAQMAAENPAVLQGLTPTVTGAVMSEIAKNPQLRAKFNAARMEPIRAQAETMLGALQSLVITDAQGNVIGLTPGARQLFGEYTPTIARDFIPTAAAADANAALQQVIGQQIVDLIAEMKRQSQSGATGFGQLNLRELDVLTSASTQLKQRLTEDAALAQLKNLYEKFQKITVTGADEQPINIRTAPGAGAALPTGDITLDTPIFIGPGGQPTTTRPGAR